jgi:hypothetical protein
MDILRKKHQRTTGKKRTYDIEYSTFGYRIIFDGKVLKDVRRGGGLADFNFVIAIGDIEELRGMQEE